MVGGSDGARGGQAGEEKNSMWHDGMPGRGHAGERKVAYGMTSMGTGTPEKGKASDFRGGCPPRKPARHPGKGKSK